DALTLGGSGYREIGDIATPREVRNAAGDTHQGTRRVIQPGRDDQVCAGNESCQPVLIVDRPDPCQSGFHQHAPEFGHVNGGFASVEHRRAHRRLPARSSTTRAAAAASFWYCPHGGPAAFPNLARHSSREARVMPNAAAAESIADLSGNVVRSRSHARAASINTARNISPSALCIRAWTARIWLVVHAGIGVLPTRTPHPQSSYPAFTQCAAASRTALIARRCALPMLPFT